MQYHRQKNLLITEKKVYVAVEKNWFKKCLYNDTRKELVNLVALDVSLKTITVLLFRFWCVYGKIVTIGF